MNDRLSAITLDIKSRMKRSAEDIFIIGKHLCEAKALLGHGNFLPWLEANFENQYGLSESTAGRYMRVYKKFKNAKLPDVEASVLYLLAEKSTPESAVDEITSNPNIGHGEAQAVITEHRQAEIMKDYVQQNAPIPLRDRLNSGELGVKQAYQLTRALEDAPEAIRQDVINLRVSDPEVIPVLARIKEKDSEKYHEIVVSKHFQGAGDPIPVDKANVRDAEDFYKEFRFEHHMQNWMENRPERWIDTEARAYTRDIAMDLHIVAFVVDEDTYNSMRDMLGREGRLIFQKNNRLDNVS